MCDLITEKERIYLIRLLKAQITKEAETILLKLGNLNVGEAPEED
jgi:hypothetical protein